MNDPRDVRVGDAVFLPSMQAVGLINNGPGVKPGTMTCSYKPPKQELFVALLLGCVKKDLGAIEADPDARKMALKAGWADTDHLISAMSRAGFSAPQAALVTQELLKMEDE